MKKKSWIIWAAAGCVAWGGRAFADSSNEFAVTNLVANSAEYDPLIVDPNMLDAWGLAIRPAGAGGHFWISNAETGTSSEYIGDVNGVALHQDGLTVVPLNTPGFTDHGYAFVTGQVYNSASDFAGQGVEFAVSGPAQDDSTTPPTTLVGGASGAAKFIFVTEDGAINAWRSNTTTAMNSAPVIVDYSKTGHFPNAANSVFTGAAITQNAVTPAQVGSTAGNHLFATDMRNNTIDVFNDQWADVTGSYHFQTPSTVGTLHPFNITDIGGHLYVSYAAFNPAGDEGMEQISGAGLGHVAEYNEDGTLVRDFSGGNNLNAPWGMAIAPAAYGKFGGALLVANFGDGTIAAFNPATGQFIDDLRDAQGNVISIDGIWALTFGNGASLGDADALYFTAGPDSETDGVFGRVTAVPEPGSLAIAGMMGVMLLLRRRDRAIS